MRLEEFVALVPMPATEKFEREYLSNRAEHPEVPLDLPENEWFDRLSHFIEDPALVGAV